MAQFIRKEAEQGDPASDPKGFRRCLGQFSTGVAVMTTISNGEPFGVTANSFSSLSIDPPLVLWSIMHTSRSLSAFTTSKHFAVNILAVDQIDFSQRFAGSSQRKFEGVEWRPGIHGAPILPDILSSLECELQTTHRGGDHVILVGRVKRYVRYAGNALLYAQGRYAVAEDHPTLLLKPSASAKAADNPVGDLRFMALLAYVEMYASDATLSYARCRCGIGHSRRGLSERVNSRSWPTAAVPYVRRKRVLEDSGSCREGQLTGLVANSRNRPLLDVRAL